MTKREIPKRLFKYRAFSNLLLDMLVGDFLYFSDPSTFNDPLDTNPTLDANVDAQALEAILGRLIEQRIAAEMAAAAKTIGYKGPKTIEHIARLSRKQTERKLAEIRYNAGGIEADDPLTFLLSQYVEEELLTRYDKGVLSLAERAECPLMWSHYGDQHRGICLGYSVPHRAASSLHRMRYGGSRMVRASDVAAMLDGDKAAQRRVDNAVLFKKAEAWGYENEWRLVGPRGRQDSFIELEEVVFGLRCESAVKYAVVKALEGRRRAVDFYEINEKRGTFTLRKRKLDTGELAASYPRRVLSVYEDFENVKVP